MTATSSFARLFRSTSTKVRSEDEDDVTKRKTDEAEDEVADPDEVEDLEDADGDEDADAKRRAKKKAKAKAKDGDDDSDDADDKDPKTRAARARERGRIVAIMGSAAGQANPSAALFIALRTNASRATAIADLVATGPSEAPSPSRQAAARARLAGVDVPDVGQGGAEPGKGSALAAQIIAAGKRRRGEI